MTDPMTVAIATAMAGKAVEVAGEPVRAAVAELCRRVRDRLRGRPGEEALERAAEDDAEIPALVGAVRHLLEADPAFRTELEAIWNHAQMQIEASDGGAVFVVNGPVDKLVQVRDVHGGLNIN